MFEQLDELGWGHPQDALEVPFIFSRCPGRWHSRLKQRYRTKSQAQAATRVWEERGRILWPEDFKGTQV